ncbi:hypothetical protein D3C72_2312940 [compost metagenome]
MARFRRTMRSPCTRRSISMKMDVMVVCGQPTEQKRRPTREVARKRVRAKVISRRVRR